MVHANMPVSKFQIQYAENFRVPHLSDQFIEIRHQVRVRFRYVVELSVIDAKTGCSILYFHQDYRFSLWRGTRLYEPLFLYIPNHGVHY